MRIRQHIGNVERKCGNCKCWDDFTGVCFNGYSDERADFTDDEFVCKWHEWKEGGVSVDRKELFQKSI